MKKLKQSIATAARRCVYGFVRQEFHTALMQEFLREMLKSNTMELKWTIKADYESGHGDLLVMSVKVESLQETNQQVIYAYSSTAAEVL